MRKRFKLVEMTAAEIEDYDKANPWLIRKEPWSCGCVRYRPGSCECGAMSWIVYPKELEEYKRHCGGGA